MSDPTRELIPEEAWALLISEPSVDAYEKAAALTAAAELERIAKGRSMIAPEELQDRAAELRGDRKAVQQ